MTHCSLATRIARYIQPDGRAIHGAMNHSNRNTGKMKFPSSPMVQHQPHAATKSPALNRGVSGGILIEKPEHITRHCKGLSEEMCGLECRQLGRDHKTNVSCCICHIQTRLHNHETHSSKTTNYIFMFSVLKETYVYQLLRN